MSQDQISGPLAGVRVLDLSRILAGPTATQLLGDYGADVIKVERPGVGDDTRKWGPPFLKDEQGADTKESGYYLAANRNKRSIEVDISSPEGVALIKRLAVKADIVVENYKFGGLAKYGLDFDSLKQVNPALVYCSITGFGHSGPNAHLPGYDLMAQGYGGVMGLTGEPDGAPMKVGVPVADLMSGLYAVTGILAALHHSTKTGEGQHIDVALVDSQISWLVNVGTDYLLTGEEPKRRGNRHPNIVPYQVYETRDGHLIVAVGNDSQFGRYSALLGVGELADDPDYTTNPARAKNRVALAAILEPLVQAMDKAELLALMKTHNVPCGEVNTVAEVFDSPQVAAREMKITMQHAAGPVDLVGNPVKLSKTPVTYRMAPPVCGVDRDEILNDWLGGDDV